MQVRLMVERGQDECIVKLAGANYKFVRNKHGHLVAEITDLLSIQWVENPRNTSFMPYVAPKPKIEPVVEPPPAPETISESNIVDEVFDEVVPAFAEPEVAMAAHFGNEGSQDTFAPPATESVVEGGAVPTENLQEDIEATTEIGGAPDAAPETGTGFPCTICGKVFEKAGQLQGHMGGAHRAPRS